MVNSSLSTITENAKNSVIRYASGLIQSSEKKNCTQMAEAMEMKHDAIYQCLRYEKILLPIYPKILLELIRKSPKKRKGWLILDDSFIIKTFSELLEGIDYAFDSGKSRSEKGYAAVVLAWTDGDICIPLDFELWFTQEMLGEHYKTKIQLAQLLIKKFFDANEFEGVILDGLYATEEMINFLNDLKIKFNMKMATTRVVMLPGWKKGVSLKELSKSELKMRRNERSRSVFAYWHGIGLYFVAHLRINKNGTKSIIYIVTNYQAPPLEHVYIYGIRWEIEKFFRTAKQSLGLQDCSSRSIDKHKVHIYCVFLSYAFIQTERLPRRKSNAEEVVKSLRKAKPSTTLEVVSSFIQSLEAFA